MNKANIIIIIIVIIILIIIVIIIIIVIFIIIIISISEELPGKMLANNDITVFSFSHMINLSFLFP